jgi:hypothetical protein
MKRTLTLYIRGGCSERTPAGPGNQADALSTFSRAREPCLQGAIAHYAQQSQPFRLTLQQRDQAATPSINPLLATTRTCRRHAACWDRGSSRMAQPANGHARVSARVTQQSQSAAACKTSLTWCYQNHVCTPST